MHCHDQANFVTKVTCACAFFLSIMLMQECCNFICQWENEPGGVPIRIKHLLHSSAVRYGEIFHSSSAREISRHISR